VKSNSSNLPALRIALVSGGLPCGGSTTFLVNFAAGLARRNIPVEVLSFEKDNPLAADFSHSDVPVFAQDKHRLIFEDQLQAILRRMSRFDPTVVLANLSSVSFEVLRYVPAGVFRAGIIHTDHGREYTLVRHYAAHMDMLAAVSKRIKLNIDGMPEFGGLPSRHIPLGVFLPTEANVARVELDRPLRIFYLGRLEREQKRAHLFPQIFEQLKESGIPFHWTIAGDGPEKCALERAMQNVPGQTVSFAGQIPHKRVPELLQAHDIFLLASNYEGLPLSLLEAMGAGLVPVVSDLPSGIPEVVDAGNGMLVPPDDVAGYARAIIHLHGHRDELAAKSAAARARVQTEFSVAAMTDRWLSAFPKNLPVIGAWPSQWNIKAPLPARHPIYFSPPVRLLRRLAAMLRQ
jgi:glycosyltransferase involved in cell wall biosynthesis